MSKENYIQCEYAVGENDELKRVYIGKDVDKKLVQAIHEEFFIDDDYADRIIYEIIEKYGVGSVLSEDGEIID